jgi:hypothetical protein
MIVLGSSSSKSVNFSSLACRRRIAGLGPSVRPSGHREDSITADHDGHGLSVGAVSMFGEGGLGIANVGCLLKDPADGGAHAGGPGMFLDVLFGLGGGTLLRRSAER